MEDGIKLGPGESFLDSSKGTGFINVQYMPKGSEKVVYLGETKNRDQALEWITEAYMGDDGTPEYADRLRKKVTYEQN